MTFNAPLNSWPNLGHPQELASPREPAKRIVVGGDTYFGEYYQEKRTRISKINYLETFGYDYSGARIAPLLERADFAIANLECALTNEPGSGLDGRKDYILRAKPAETVRALKALNIGGVLLGNNHAMDYLSDGLSDTLEYLSEAGIAFSGAGRTRKQAQQAIRREFDVDGIPFKLAVLSGYEYNSWHEELGFYAGDKKMGVNNINLDRLKRQIADLRSQGYFVIASPHWGSNYCFRTHDQSRLARRIVGLGADLILGHGPHMMNELVQIDGVWVVYSLGNLIFNSEGEYQRHGRPPYSLVAELELRRQESAIKGCLNLYPIVSCNQLTQFQPTFLDDHQFEQVVLMVNAMSYGSGALFDGAAPRKVGGRNCLTMNIF